MPREWIALAAAGLVLSGCDGGGRVTGAATELPQEIELARFLCLPDPPGAGKCANTPTMKVSRVFFRRLKAEPEWICVSSNQQIRIELPANAGRGRVATRAAAGFPAWLDAVNDADSTTIVLTPRSSGEELKFGIYEDGRCPLDPRVTVRGRNVAPSR